MRAEDREPVPGLRKTQSWTFPQLSGSVFELATSGMPRVLFLKETLRRIIDYIGCDAIKLVFLDQGSRFRCLISTQLDEPFRFDKIPETRCRAGRYLWSSEENETLERLCEVIVSGQIGASYRGATARGSFLVNNVSDSLLAECVSSRSDYGLGISIEESCRSLLIAPFQLGRERCGLIQFQSARAGFFVEDSLEYVESIAYTLGTAMMHRNLQVRLRERTKELTCLYGIAKVVALPESSLDGILKQAVELLPPGWLYPDCATARIVLDGKSYTATNYRRTTQSMKSPILMHRKERGFVEIGYLWEQPEIDEGPFLREERNLLDAVSRDIAQIVEQKESEAEKRGLEEQLRRADRLATIGQLAAGSAHELNEPLSNILGFAQLMSKVDGLPEQTKKDLDRIISAALLAREVVRKLLVFARQTRPDKTKFDLNILVDECLYFLDSRCSSANIGIVRSLAEDLPNIDADRSQIQQVLTNLIVNSIQAMPDGGTLTVSTSAEAGWICFSVQDTGVGIPEEVMNRIFDPFFTTKDVNEGTGLGLSVVHGIVSSHHGRIDVSSQPDQGTTFEIRLPGDSAELGEGIV